jgi:Aldo/keto reductases, related to diketogulonate reductase
MNQLLGSASLVFCGVVDRQNGGTHMTTIKNIKLNNGVLMPMEGFGVYQIKDLAKAQDAVQSALKLGYRSIDTAQVYGNETAVGAAVKASGIPRKIFF